MQGWKNWRHEEKLGLIMGIAGITALAISVGLTVLLFKLFSYAMNI